MLPVSWIFYVLQDKFRKVCRDMKRLDSVYNGRLMTQIAETAA